MTNPYTVQTYTVQTGFAQTPLPQFATCNVHVHRNPERYRSNLRRLQEADHSTVCLPRMQLEEDDDCFWKAVTSRYPFETWQQVEWFKKMRNPRIVRRMYSYVHITPDQEESVRDAICWLQGKLLNAINKNAPRPEYTLVIYTR